MKRLVDMGKIFPSFLVVLMTLVVSTTVFPQYDFMSYTWKPNPGLKKKIHKGKIALVESFKIDGFYEQWATSMLKPTRLPKMPKIDYFETDFDEGIESLCNYLGRLGQYSAYRAMDKNPKTAWVEGVPGDGIGEIVIVRVDTRKPVRIWAGYGESEDIFKKNNRPKQICVYVLQGRLDWDRSAEGGDAYTDIHVVAKHVVTLKDLNGYQPLSLPQHTIRDKKAITFVAVEILSVYPGTKYKDTCISEIGN